MRIVPIEDIKISENRQRKEFTPEALIELQSSLETGGLQNAIVVREQNGELILVSGERRLRAIKELYSLDVPIKYNTPELSPNPETTRLERERNTRVIKQRLGIDNARRLTSRENPYTGKPKTENTSLLSTNITKERITKETMQTPPEFEEFKNYAVTHKSTLDLNALRLKYNSWAVS